MKCITEQQVITSDHKIVMMVADGLGGLQQSPEIGTELEVANTPNLDKLAKEGVSGLLDPIGYGITPGSGPAHLALFGYDPIEHNVGRGLLSALGLDFELEETDIAARGNFCTIDEEGNVTDRRAGRVPTSISEGLCKKLQDEVFLSDIRVFVIPEKDHRFLLVLRGEGLSEQVQDTDPQLTGIPPRKCQPLNEAAARTARIIDDFTVQAQKILTGQPQANGVLLRGVAKKLLLRSMSERFGLKTAALADYPMYRGLAKLVGMDVISREHDLVKRARVIKENRDKYDFFYFHFKKTDAMGEDGNFDGKVKAIEEFDSIIPVIMEADIDVLVITGDHSTPAVMAAHSWHPVPVLMHGRNVRTDGCEKFGEKYANFGGLGRFPMKYLVPNILAQAGKLTKFGA